MWTKLPTEAVAVVVVVEVATAVEIIMAEITMDGAVGMVASEVAAVVVMETADTVSNVINVPENFV